MNNNKTLELSSLAKNNADKIMAVFVGFGQIETQMNLILNLFFIKKDLRKIADEELWNNESMFRIKIHLIGVVAKMQGVEISKEKLNKCAELRNQFAHGLFYISSDNKELILKNGATQETISEKINKYAMRLKDACDEMDKISESLELPTFKEIFGHE